MREGKSAGREDYNRNRLSETNITQILNTKPFTISIILWINKNKDAETHSCTHRKSIKQNQRTVYCRNKTPGKSA